MRQAKRSKKARPTWSGSGPSSSAAGIPTEAELAYGEPAKEIVKWVEQKGCDLVAMSTHGHKFVADLVLGTTAFQVQHSLRVPVLLLRAR